MNWFYAILIAFSMYSRVPLPKVEWTKARMRYVFCFFPLIGVLIGALMMAWMRYGSVIAGDGNLFTAVLVLIPVLVTGGIHMDGFLDTADALSSYKPMEEKLEILKDSHAGAFAVLTGGCYFLLDFGVYSEVTAEVMPVLAVGFVLSRTLSGLSVVAFQKAKNTGLAATFSDMAQKRCVAAFLVVYFLICAALLPLIGGWIGVLCLLTALAVFVYYRQMSYKKFGGITGDLAGFFVQVCELAMALAVVTAARFL